MIDTYGKPEGDDLTQYVNRVLDGECGVVRYISVTDLQPDEPRLFVGIAEMVDASKVEPLRVDLKSWEDKAIADSHSDPAKLNAPSGTIHSSGAGLDRKTALWATIGEACERYAMNYCHPDDLLFESPEKMGTDNTFIDKLILFSEQQYNTPGFPYKRYNPGEKRAWMKGCSLVDGSEKMVPAELCIGNIPYEYSPLDSTYSTGCAAGPSYERAIQSGLSEAIERDAFIYYWLTAHKPKKLELDDLREFLNEKLLHLIDFPNININLRWLETDLDIPVVISAITTDNARGLACGAACHPDWRIAVEKAIVESFHTLNWTVDLDRSMWRREKLALEDIRDFPDHVRFYLHPDHHAFADFLITNDTIDGTADFLSRFNGRVNSVKQMIALLNTHDYEPVVVDRTYDDLESIGMFVVHVFVPGLHPLHVGVGREHLDRRRLEKISRHLGITCPEKLNLNPHPFP